MAQAALDRQAALDARAAFAVDFGRAPTENELLFGLAVSRGESNYGRGTFRNLLTGERIGGTWNMGSLQCNVRPPCPPGCFEATDSTQEGTHYQACFMQFDSPQAGWEKFWTVLYVNAAPGSKFDRRPVMLAANTYPDKTRISELVNAGGFDALKPTLVLKDGKGTRVPLSRYYHVAHFSRAMRDSGYFGLPMQPHVEAMVTNIRAIERNTGLRLDRDRIAAASSSSSIGKAAVALGVFAGVLFGASKLA